MSSNNLIKSLSVETKKETSIDEATKKLNLNDSHPLTSEISTNGNTKIPNISINQIKTAFGSFNSDEMSPSQINMFTVNYWEMLKIADKQDFMMTVATKKMILPRCLRIMPTP